VLLAIFANRTVLLTRLLATRVALTRHLTTVGVVLAVRVAIAGSVRRSQILPTVELRTRRNLGFALVPCAQSTFALLVIFVAEFPVSTVRLRFGASAPVWLTHDDVAEPALALQILVTMFVVA